MTDERRIVLPDWVNLTDEEVVTALSILSQRKSDGTGFAIDESQLPEWYTVKVPTTCALRREDIVTVLNVANRAALELHADAILKFQDGVIVNKRIELKPAALPNRLQIGGPHLPRQW